MSIRYSCIIAGDVPLKLLQEHLKYKNNNAKCSWKYIFRCNISLEPNLNVDLCSQVRTHNVARTPDWCICIRNVTHVR